MKLGQKVTPLHCGCSPGMDRTGWKVDKLLVIDRGRDSHHWLCRCDCGVEKEVSIGVLRGVSKFPKTCGCMFKSPEYKCFQETIHRTPEMLQRGRDLMLDRWKSPGFRDKLIARKEAVQSKTNRTIREVLTGKRLPRWAQRLSENDPRREEWLKTKHLEHILMNLRDLFVPPRARKNSCAPTKSPTVQT